MKTLAFLAIGLGLLLPAAPSRTTLQPADLGTNSFFGYSVSADGNLMAVGAPLFNTQFTGGSGSVYIFQRTGGGGWTQQAKLQAPVLTNNDWFGMSVALQGNMLLVGAPRAAGTGQIFEFRLNNGSWQYQQTLSPVATDIRFGSTIAYHRGTLAVGSGAINTSSVYLYNREQTGWSAPVRIKGTAPGLADVMAFGAAIAIQDNTMVIGAPQSPTINTSSGVAFIYNKRNGVWNQDAILSAPSGANVFLYGWSVAINGTRIAVGAPLGDQAGTAYVYNLANGAATLSFAIDAPAAGAAPGANFGQEVSLFANTLAVGAPAANGGSTVFFTLNGDTWTKTAQEVSDSGTFQALLGQQVELPDNNTTIIAAPGWSSDTQPLKGAVYIIQK